MVPGRVGSRLRKGLSFCLDEVPFDVGVGKLRLRCVLCHLHGFRGVVC